MFNLFCFKDLMKIMNNYKVKKAVASSTVNSIVADVLQLFQTKSYDSQKYPLYQKIVLSDYLQNSHFERTYEDYLKPEICETITDIDGQNYHLKHTRISVISYVQKVLKNSSIVNHILGERRSTQQSLVIESPMNCQIASRISGHLKLEIFLDDSQIAPSGIFNKTQKFLCVYITVADIPYQYRVKSEDISILLLVNRKKLQNLNLKDPFEALFFEVKKEILFLVNNGIEVTNSKGEKQTIKVTISTILGDNLGIYQFLGFRCSFQNRSFVCRFCSAKGKSTNENETDIQNLFSRNQLLKNPTPDEHGQAGVKSPFTFDGIGGLNRWNVSPPDAVNLIFFTLFISN